MEASFYAGIGGAFLGWLAIVFGAIDLLKLYKNRQDAMLSALIHGGINATVVLVFSILILMKYPEYPDIRADSATILIMKVAAIGLMLNGNFIGAQLILKYKVVE